MLGGLDHKNADPGNDGAGDHARANATFLTGVRMKKSATDIRAGISIDQLIARQIGHLTRFPSLELSCDARPQLRRLRLRLLLRLPIQSVLELADDAGDAGVEPAAGVRAAVRRAAHGERAENFATPPARAAVDARLRARRRPRAASAGSARDDAASSTSTSPASARSSTDPAVPSSSASRPIPDVGPRPASPRTTTSTWSSCTICWSLAFQTDSTRVATLLLAHDGSNRPFDESASSKATTTCRTTRTARTGRQGRSEIDQWYVEQFAEFLDKLAEDQGRRRQLAAAQLDDRLWRRQRRRQPPHARESAGGPRRRGGGTLPPAASSSTAESRPATCSSPSPTAWESPA